MGGMVSWQEFERQAPELAARVRGLFGTHRHKVMATLRADGSPRVSGTEVEFRDGQVWLGSMPGARKAADLRRDPRVAIHTSSPDPDEADPSAWVGDAKLAGRAQEVTDPGEGSHLFRVEVEEAVWTRVEGEEMVIDMWHAGRGLRRVRRK
jgi:hypothetical protein